MIKMIIMIILRTKIIIKTMTIKIIIIGITITIMVRPIRALRVSSPMYLLWRVRGSDLCLQCPVTVSNVYRGRKELAC